VVEDDVQNHFHPRRVQGLHHLLELVDHRAGLAADATTGVGERPAGRSPNSSAAHRLAMKAADGESCRHQLHCGDAERIQIRNLLMIPR
jgi:hypothetical protein